MKLVPWQPFGELRTLSRKTEDSWSLSFDKAPFPRLVLGEWVPWVDISETKENVVVKAELPGLGAKDIKVSTSGNVLTIKGEKKCEEEERDEHYYYCERYRGSFYRSLRLHVSVQSDKVKETLKDGVLKITLPKAEEPEKEVPGPRKDAPEAKAKPKAKATKRAPAKKKTAAPTATDQVVNIIKSSKKGVDTPTLMKRTGLADKTVRNILFRASKQGRIKRSGRGVYVAA